MKHVRLSVRPDLDRAPPFLAYLLESSAVRRALAIDWNRGASSTSTHLYGIDGDADQFGSLARETTGVDAVTMAETDAAVSYAHLELRDEAVPIFGGTAVAVDRDGLVLRRPILYRDGEIHGHVVGSSEVCQAAIDELPDAVDVRIEAIRTFPSAQIDPSTDLSDRQREALEVAVDLGYYETPRRATHDDVAAELGCAPNTASEHLQKGEAKLVRAGLGGLRSSF